MGIKSLTLSNWSVIKVGSITAAPELFEVARIEGGKVTSYEDHTEKSWYIVYGKSVSYPEHKEVEISHINPVFVVHADFDKG